MQRKKTITQPTTQELSDWKTLVEFVKQSTNTDDLKKCFIDHIRALVATNKLVPKYKILYLFDSGGFIRDYEAKKISIALGDETVDDLLVIINSNGGHVEPAYLISKNCIEHSNKFIVSVNDLAKSAATLISLGATEIHMGSLSQLGPIDPQINGLPALAVNNSLEYLASLCKKYPDAKDMFAAYLSNKLDVRELGYLQRVSESSIHYGERLLKDKLLPEPNDAHSVAKALVHSYKDHNFVIDHNEAKLLLGDIIKFNTSEYKLSKQVATFLDNATLLLNVMKKKTLTVVGSVDDMYIADLK